MKQRNPEWGIYGLVDPRTEKIRYIGISQNVFKRYREHTQIIDLTTPKGQWVNDLYVHGMRPMLLLMGIAQEESIARAKEKAFIEQYGKNDLFNFIHNTANRDGGERIDNPELEAIVLAELQGEWQ